MPEKYLDSVGLAYLWEKMKSYATNETYAAAKNYSDTNLASAKLYSDANLITAKSYADTKIAALVNSSPAALDTLNELAKALGNDPNFATTITNKLASKANVSDLADYLSNSGGNMFGSIDFNQTSSFVPNVKYIEQDTSTVYTLYIPASNGTFATQEWVTAKKYLTSIPTASTSQSGAVKIGSNITVSSGVISLSSSNVTSALGYTPPTPANTIKSLSVSGTTITYTRADGTTGSITTQDTNTTYTLSSFGITASSTELNYVKGVTSAIQTQLNNKANTSALASYLPLSGGIMTGMLTLGSGVAGFGREIEDDDGGTTVHTIYVPYSGGTMALTSDLPVALSNAEISAAIGY